MVVCNFEKKFLFCFVYCNIGNVTLCVQLNCVVHEELVILARTCNLILLTLKLHEHYKQIIINDVLAYLL